MWFLIPFVLLPILEIALFVQIGGAIGVGATILWVLASAVIGVWVMRRQGAAAMADLQRAVGEVAATLHRYPDREAVALRTDLAGYLSARTGVPLQPDQVWAANGSNEVLQQVLQAFGGSDRVALSFAPHYAMYPEYARNTLTTWVSGRRQEDFTLDLANVRS